MVERDGIAVVVAVVMVETGNITGNGSDEELIQIGCEGWRRA